MDMIWVLLGGPDFPLASQYKYRPPRGSGVNFRPDSASSTMTGSLFDGGTEASLATSHSASSDDEEEEKSVRRLEEGEHWEQFVEEHVSESTRTGNARLRLKKVYPPAWLYDNEEDLFDLCIQRCPGLPLPPYWCDVSIRSQMSYTPIDEAPAGTSIRKALEAAVLLDNERAEKHAEELEKQSGILRQPLEGEKQMARVRNRKLALVIGNSLGPGNVKTAVCVDDAKTMARQLRDLNFDVSVVVDGDKKTIMKELRKLRDSIEESDLITFYFSGHARRANGINYLVPAGGPHDWLDETSKYAERGIRLREDVLHQLQSQKGTLTIVFLDVFRASPAITAPPGKEQWRQGKGNWMDRFPACFLPHIRPPGTPASVVIPSEDGRTLPRMQGNMDGLPANTYALLAGDPIEEEKDLESLLQEDGSMCLVYSNDPGGALFPDDNPLLSPFTRELAKHVHNPGGGANGSGGGYPMMLADIKSDVMRVTQGRQCPWTKITEDADKIFSFTASAKTKGRTKGMKGMESRVASTAMSTGTSVTFQSQDEEGTSRLPSVKSHSSKRRESL